MSDDQTRLRTPAAATHDVIRFVSLGDPIARPLLDELDDEYSTRYEDFDGFEKPENAPSEIELFPPLLFEPPWGAALLVLREGEPVAGGAFMHLDARTVEYKRIWTSARHRRQGLSRLVLQALDDEAAARGYSRVYLTTGPRQPEAKYLYLKTGFTPLFDLDADPEEVVHLAFEKRIEPTAPRTTLHGLREHVKFWRQRRKANWAHRYHPGPSVRLDDVEAAAERSTDEKQAEK